MLEILKEWGPVIIAAAAIVFLVAIVKSDVVQTSVSDAFTSIIDGMSQKTNLINP